MRLHPRDRVPVAMAVLLVALLVVSIALTLLAIFIDRRPAEGNIGGAAGLFWFLDIVGWIIFGVWMDTR